jgi:lipid II:glycine glycyltransferase (peptidoglycan interpeptide bridge formation enzyme)
MDQPPNNWDKDRIRQGASFLQSKSWGDFQSSLGVKPHYLSGDGWSCLLLEKQNRAGRYLFSQYGPTVDSLPALRDALNQITSYAHQLGAAWVSLEPMSSHVPPDELKKIVRKSGALTAARNREPDLTRIVDLRPEADKLLAGISQSTRSFIRKNQREKLINFKSSQDPSDIKIFTGMIMGIAQRKNIYFYSEQYFAKQAQQLVPPGMLHVELAYQDDKPVAAALFHDYGHKTTYTYAASVPEARQTNASALLLWQAMLNAKGRGAKQIDLYGIAPPNAPPNHPWAGFTSFKAKFGGEVVEYPGTWDIKLSNRYLLYRSAHKARKVIKRH